MTLVLVISLHLFSMGIKHLSFRCWSYVGRQYGGQILSIGSGCDELSIVEHELLHALGFWHEQSRYDRDEYVTIVTGNIEAG